MAQPLTPQLILATARELLDVGGREALSMRTLAARLEVKAASLYNHISGKQELLQGIVDDFATETMAGLDATAGWRQNCVVLAERLRETLRRHPGATEVIATVNVSPEVARRIAEEFGPHFAGELQTTTERAMLTFQSLYVLVVGLALAEFGDVPNDPVAPREFYDGWFQIATETFIDGIASRLAAGDG
jgi:TetR/AcrR family tetracycline transcriptional repressor